MTDEKKSGNSYVLAIDLGSGGPKVGLVSQDGSLAASAVGSTPVTLLPGGGAEQDPHEWWATSLQAARQVIREAGVPAEAIRAVACTSQFSVIVPVDENGQALMNAVHWMDTRGAPYNRALMSGFPAVQGYNLGKLVKWMRRVGMPPVLSGADALGHILFIKNERPDIYRKTFKFLEPADYLNLRLTGRCAATLNTVLPYMLTDNRRLDGTDYDRKLLQIAGLDRAKLPEILPIDGIVGMLTSSVASELGLSTDTMVITAANDNSTSAIGSGAVADFDSVAVLGNSGYLACHLPFMKTDLLRFITTMPSALPGRYLIFAELGNNGKVLDSYLNNFIYPQDEFGGGGPPADVYERMNALAEAAPPGSEGVLFLPWFNGGFSPSEDPYMRGGFLNLSIRTTRAHMTRAVLEGMAMNWRWLLGAVEKFTGRKIDQLRLGGGGALSSAWAQIMADVTGVPMQQLANPRFGNVMGIAFLAFNRLGMLSLEDIPGKVEIAKIYEPRGEYRPVYDELFRHFLASLKKLRPVFHALNR